MRQKRDPQATRRLLLEAAFAEIYEHGFQAASLENILAQTGVTKGALYHHFRNKQALGYAVVDEVLAPIMRQRWIEPMGSSDDPVATFHQILDRMRQEKGFEKVQWGCPVNNLAQEMSPLDEGFRQRIQRIFDSWQQAIEGALRRGQRAGTLRDDLDPERVAFFIVAAFEGTLGLAKNRQREDLLDAGMYGIEQLLRGLRPTAALST